MTATTMITRALRLLRIVFNPGQTAGPQELAEGLITANDMLDEWSTQRANIFNVGTAAYPLTTAVGSYLIGPAQTINAPRPLRIERAGILVANPNGTGTVRFPLSLLSEREWDALPNKTIKTSPVPTDLYIDNAWPYANINLSPIPTFSSGTAPKLELSTWSQLTDFPDLTTDETFPPGYEEALTFNLAVRLVPAFGRNCSDAAMARIENVAATSLVGIRSLNLALEHEGRQEEAWAAQQPDNNLPAGPVNALEVPKQ